MIGWRDGEGAVHRGSLFATFAALARGEAWSFPALRPHQREPWHAFAVQVGALALIRAGVDELPADEAGWRDLLLALTPDQPEAWELVVEDWSKPALLQPPVVSAGNRADYKSRLATPDALDMLVTAKNHDVKQERIAQASDEDWLFALVTLQTTEGFLGAGNYGISRMNGGFASRMSLGVRPSGGGAAAAFRRDVRQLVANARSRPDRRTGLPLLWTIPWGGTESHNFTKLDELYVEVCRRIRLHRGVHGLYASGASSSCARIAAGRLGGNTGDPWIPLAIDAKKGSKTEGMLVSVTAGSSGFGYRQMARLLNKQQVTLPLLAQLHDEDDPQGLSIVAAVLVRGQGKTEGLHRRAVRTSRMKEIEEYGPSEDTALDRIGDVAMRRSKDAGDAASILTSALSQMIQGGPAEADVRGDDKSTKEKVKPWRDEFDDVVDKRFFGEDFWTEAAGTTEVHARPWRLWLAGVTRDLFERAVDSGPRTEMRRLQAWARARNYLDRRLDKWVKESVDGAS